MSRWSWSMILLIACVTLGEAATASWQPSLGARGYNLYYGLASRNYDTVLDVGTETSAVVDDLTVGQTYYFAVTAYNTAGESDYSAEVAYTVPEPPPIDVTPPTVELLSPDDGAVVPRKSVVTIVADAADDVGVASVEFYVNGGLLCTDTTSLYSCQWKTPGAKNRRYTITALAVDTSGHVSALSAPVVVTTQ